MEGSVSLTEQSLMRGVIHCASNECTAGEALAGKYVLEGFSGRTCVVVTFGVHFLGSGYLSP